MINLFREKCLGGVMLSLANHTSYSNKDVTLPVETLIKIFKEIGCYMKEDLFEASGFYYDYNLPFIYNGNNFILRGNGYYGGIDVVAD